MKNIYDIVARRSLNHAKSINPIMYLAIRCFFDSFSAKAKENDSFVDFIERKLYVRNHWSAGHYKLFKEKNAEDFIFRDILSLSAFGIVAESYLIMKISASNYIKNKEYVYSYLLPKVGASRNYEYYFTGYKKRNESISNVFEQNKDHVAIVLDLTKFYPSIYKTKAKNIFLSTLGKELDGDIFKLSEGIVSSMLKQSIEGVPIGTSLSHLLAQTYLLEFDENLSNKFPNMYFRYVDDIIIICKPSEEKEVEECVAKLLPEGLEINDSKTDILNYVEWKLLNRNYDSQDENLHDILHFITAYLAMRPSRFDELSKLIHDSRYNVPLKRIKQQAKNRMFMLFLKSFLKKKKKYTPLEIYFTKPKVIVGKLLALKTFYNGVFNNLVKLNYNDSNSAENRSNTQRLKYVINRLLYLSTIDELSELMDKMPNTEKLKDTKEVIYALNTKDLSGIIQYGGKVVQTVCELWMENDFETLILQKEDIENIPNINDTVDSLIVLYLHKVVSFEIEEILEYLDGYNQEYLQVVLNDSYRVKETSNIFLLEIQGLLEGKSLEDKYDLLTTRYDDGEEIQLAGLDLGLGYSL